MTRRALVLPIVLLPFLTFPLTITGASVALPDIRDDLHSSLAATQWVVNGYNATFASFLVLAGSLADVLGRRRVFASGVVLFFGSAVVCSLAGDIVLLNAVRLLGGIGAAATVTSGSSIIADTFTGQARVKAFGLVGTTLGVGLAFGPTVGGALVDAFGWRGVFAVPAALAGLVLLGVPALPKAAGAHGRRVDWLGAALFTGGLLLVIFAFVQGPELGFGHPVIVAAFVGGIALGALFTYVERRVDDPMFELGLLANPRFLSMAIAAAAIVVVLVPLLVYLPSYLIANVGLDAGTAGIWLLMLTAPTVLLPTAGAALAKRVPIIWLVAGSVAVTSVGVLSLTTIGPDSTPLTLAVPLALTGAGFGLSTGLMDGLAIGAVEPEQAGTASGMFSAARLASETVGIAVVGAILASLSGDLLEGPDYTSALHTVCLALGGFGVVATAAVVAVSRRGGTSQGVTGPVTPPVKNEQARPC
ncbi:MFS transporter [Actinomadura barringtoniae]|uniref:MFS transporter n=1 Tax=Actinomadura barringtoniae TaxID=1427535 RepID=A0A939T2E3_9ACTN|nr:MFS transporter [Actinomadura barringtoniae]MBO2446453.1 MFS transporter [Actinomadura barringtoniae]